MKDSKNLLLDAASALMIERNDAQVTLRDVAERSGVNSSMVKYYFGDKKGLLEALLERDSSWTFKNLDALVASDMPAIAKMRNHIHGLIKFYIKFPYINRLVGTLALENDPETAKFIAERVVSPVAEAQRAILEQGIKEGVFRDVDPKQAYFMIIGATDFLFHARYALQHMFGTDTVSDELRKSYSELITDLLFKGLLTDPRN